MLFTVLRFPEEWVHGQATIKRRFATELLGGRLCKKSPGTEFIVSFWFFFFEKGLSWERAELGEGWVGQRLSWGNIGLSYAQLGKGRAELVEGWVGWGLSWGQFWKKGWVGRELSWKRAELGGEPAKGPSCNVCCTRVGMWSVGFESWHIADFTLQNDINI